MKLTLGALGSLMVNCSSLWVQGKVSAALKLSLCLRFFRLRQTTPDPNRWLNRKFPRFERKGEGEPVMTKLLSTDGQVGFWKFCLQEWPQKPTEGGMWTWGRVGRLGVRYVQSSLYLCERCSLQLLNGRNGLQCLSNALRAKALKMEILLLLLLFLLTM